LGKLVRFGDKLIGFVFPFRLILEQVRIVVMDHAGAGTGRRHDVVAMLERANEIPRHFAGFILVAAVEGRLAAAGLHLRKIDLAPVSVKQPDDAFTDLRIQLVG
jgi:hypothetical protein